MLLIIGAYLAVGLAVGVLAGLLGVGGGLIVVPMLAFGLTHQGVAGEHIMHLALGTSLASIAFTSVSSFWAHHKRGAVHWFVVRRIVPGILVGTFLGSWLVSFLTTGFLKAFFALFLLFVAAEMLFNRSPAPSRNLPGTVGMFGVGNTIGILSSMVGIGGGTLSVPFMLWCDIPLREAIGTSAAIGFPIAIGGALGYILHGLHASGLPPHSLGFVYLPALAGIVCASVLAAPLGVRLAHTMPVVSLKRVFAVLLLVVGTRMLLSLV